MVAYLHCSPAQTVSRDQLLELLWSDTSPDKGRHTLRQTFWYIRQKLGVDPFTVVGDSVRLAIAIPSDRDAFLAALGADDPDLAVRLYQGDFFPDFAAPGGAEFEQWADLERSRLRALFLSAATRVVRDRLAKGHARDAITIARRVHDLARRQQAAWRLLLESYLAADDSIGAAVELERLERWLTEDELEPEPATAQLIKSARAGRPTGQEQTGIDAEADEPTGLRAELVGRESEFSELLAAVETAKRGQSRHVHVSAAAGHGKTRLLEGFSARLRATRTRVVAVRATPAERSLPYAFAAQLVAALASMRGASAVAPDTARTLVALAPASSSYLNAEPDKSTGDEALRRRSLAVSELVATIAHDAPLVILVDDVHWMDAQSRTVLASLATRLTSASVLLVTAARSNDRWVDETPSAHRIALAPLTVDDVGALVMSIGRLPAEPWSDAFVKVLHGGCKGSPLLALETLHLVMERDQLHLTDGSWSTDDADALISTLSGGRVLQQRISALPMAARDALLRLSVAGIALDKHTLPSVLPLDSRDALSLLETRGLIMHAEDSWRVAHDEIAAIAIEMAPDADRMRANETMAAHLERSARDDVSMLLRAAWHRARANDSSALDRVFARVVHSAHLSGEHAAIRNLGREVIGQAATTDDVDALVKRLPWRLRRRREPWVSSVLLSASLAVLAIAMSVRNSVSTPSTQLSAAFVIDDGARSMGRVTVAPNELSSAESIEVESEEPTFALAALDSVTVFGTLADGDLLGATMSARIPRNGTDLVRVNRDGRIRRIANGIHDQSGGVVSPDGYRIAYVSGEWHPNQRTEVAVLDSGATVPRRLTRTDAREGIAVWSPDGSQLAFVRTHMGENQRAEVCWIGVDGSDEQCRITPFRFIPSSLVGWNTEHGLLVTGRLRTESGEMLLSVPLDSRDVTVIDSSGSRYLADPSGRAVLCTCYVAGYGEPVVAMFSPNAPASKRVLLRDGRPLPPTALGTVFWPRRSNYLAAVSIRGPEMAYVGQRSSYFVSGLDAANRSIAISFRPRWSSLDPRIAMVDSDGNALMLAPGVARIVASTSGWRADTLLVQVRPSTHSVKLREDWRGPLTSQWVGFGRDPSYAVPSSGVLRVNGGAHLGSGVFSKATIDARVGGGVHLQFRLPVSVGQWQRLVIGLDPVADDAAIAKFVASRLPEIPESWPSRNSRNCFFSAPRDEGGEYIDLIAFTAGTQAVSIPRTPRRVTDSAWHSITLQVFSDGRCGLAIDDAFVALSRTTINVDMPLRVWIHGQSVGTTVEIGAVESWTGIRNDIDWHAQRTAALNRDSALNSAARSVPLPTRRAVEIAPR